MKLSARNQFQGNVTKINEAHFVSHLMIIRMQSGPEERHWYTKSCIIRVITPAVDPFRMSGRIPRQIKPERLAPLGIHFIDDVAKLV